METKGDELDSSDDKLLTTRVSNPWWFDTAANKAEKLHQNHSSSVTTTSAIRAVTHMHTLTRVRPTGRATDALNMHA
jgi:hypothetical protein